MKTIYSAFIIELDNLVNETLGSTLLNCIVGRYLRRLNIRKAWVDALSFDIGFTVGFGTGRRRAFLFLISWGGRNYLVVLFKRFSSAHIRDFLYALSMCLNKSIRLIRESMIGFNLYLYGESVRYSINRNVDFRALIREEIETILYKIGRMGYKVWVNSSVELRKFAWEEMRVFDNIENLEFRSSYKRVVMLKALVKSLFIVGFNDDVEEALRSLFYVKDENLKKTLLAKVIRAILELIELGEIFIIH